MRRNYTWLGVCVVLFLILLYWLSTRRHFSWNPTFLHDDDEPMGCMVFDSLAAMTSQHGYSYINVPFDEIASRTENISLLVVNDYLHFNSDEIKLLEEFVKRGNDVMLVCDNMNYTRLDDELKPGDFIRRLDEAESRVVRYDFDVDGLRLSMADNMTVTLFDDTSPTDTFVVNQYFITAYLTRTVDSRHWKKLVSTKYLGNNLPPGDKCVAMVTSYGKGKVYWVSLPYLFTNYGALNPEISRIQRQLLTYLDNKPIVRILDVYTKVDPPPHKSDTVLRYLLDHRPLRWALYTSLAILLLFMLFKARRRQRVIPYVEPPRNLSLDFVRLVGSIYNKRIDYDDMLRKKYNFFTDELRRSRLIDLADRQNLKKQIALLANTTGLDVGQVTTVIEHILKYVDGESVPDSKELYKCHNEMNQLLKLCRNNRENQNKPH